MRKDSKMKKAMLLATATVAGAGPIISSVPNINAQEVTLIDENIEEEVVQEETIIKEENTEEENTTETETIIDEEETVIEDEVTKEEITEEQETTTIEEVVEKAILNDTTTTESKESEEIEINETNFPDADFRAWVKETFDTDSDGYLSFEERNNTTYSSVKWDSDANFSDVTGIQYLTCIKTLEITAFSGEEIDLSNLPNLNKVIVSNTTQTGSLKKMIFNEKNTAMDYLKVQAGNFEEIEGLDYLVNLTTLNVSYSNVISLDCRNLTKLVY